MTHRSPFLDRWLAPVALALSMLLAACAAPTTNAGGSPAAAPEAVADTGTGTDTGAPDPATLTPPPRSTDTPPRTIDRPGSAIGQPGGTVQVDRSCKTDADCTVKNVGNCCGHYPACVNVNSPTDPEGVQAACARSGMASVCGFPAISSCQCVQGQCEGNSRVLLD
nr:hypothetical protein [Lysobacter arseniciresistens]